MSGLAIGLIGMGWDPDLGGVESHTRDLARELVSRGHRLHALALDGGEGREPFSLSPAPAAGVELVRMAYRYHDHRALIDLVERPRAAEVVLDWARARRLDLVHVHHASGWGLSLLPALRSAGFAVVMTLHDYWPLCPRGQMVRTDGEVCVEASAVRCAPCLARTWPHLMPSLQGEMRGPGGTALGSAAASGGSAATPDEQAADLRTRYSLQCLRAAQRLFAPSQATRAVYVQAGIPAEQIEVVENGIDVEELARETRRLRALEPARAELRLGVLGTVLPSKGALELARALLVADVPELVLEIHGQAPAYHGDRAYVEELERLAATDPRVRLAGPFAHERLPALLARLDGVAAPSRWKEVYGLTVREARAAGLPVLVSSAGALPDVAEWGAAGLVVPSEDPQAWVAALRRFADPAQRASWAAHEKRPRDARAMTLQLERAYCEQVRALRGRLPRLDFEPGQERKRARGPRAWLERWLERRGSR